jgi:hypothetical protein
MPPTTTKNSRTNRPDTRPNEKKRRALRATKADHQIIQDLKVTKKQKHEKKEREVQVSDMRKKTKSEIEKQMRGLKKKLRGIEELLEMEKKGQSLDAQQRIKVDSLTQVLQALEDLTAIDSFPEE